MAAEGPRSPPAKAYKEVFQERFPSAIPRARAAGGSGPGSRRAARPLGGERAVDYSKWYISETPPGGKARLRGARGGRLWWTALSRHEIIYARDWRGSRRFPHVRPQAKPRRFWSMARPPGEKTLDKLGLPPYATPSMRSPLSPEMLNRGATVQVWTERGDPLNAGQEEGCQEGDQEEEVSAPGKKGGWRITPHFFLVGELTASIAGRALRTA